MSPIQDCIDNKNTKVNPIWLMRQAGRYLPEFREIRKENPNFIELCLNENLSKEITIQPLKRFDLSAAIIFSDILMLPFGLGQRVEFKKNLGPILQTFNMQDFTKITDEKFSEKLSPIYKLITKVSKDKLLKGKDLIGFVGAPWTLLVYMLNKKSPKKNLDDNLFNDEKLINEILKILDHFLKLHIKNQVDNGASIIQIFDSWAGLVKEKDVYKYIYSPTLSLVNYTKSLGVKAICFPRNIKNYKEFSESVKPNVLSIDYNVDPKEIVENIDLPIQGGLDPKILLLDKETLKKKTNLYLEIFKDHPYIFNLGHGVLPETNPDMVKFLVEIVKNYK